MGSKINRSRRSTKAHSSSEPQASTYEALCMLNYHCRAIMDILAALADQGEVDRQESQYHRAMVSEFRAIVSQLVLERLNDREIQMSTTAARKRRRLEKAFEITT